MGQRVNYVIKNGEHLSIHYHHWRANSIASDLYLGEKTFLRYVQECKSHDALMDPIWMEGFVIVDMEEKRLGFWAWEFEAETSVIRYYLSALQNKWRGWQILYLANYMYDAEPLMGIDYISQQTIPEFEAIDTDRILNDPKDSDPGSIFIIRENGNIFVCELNYILSEHIIAYGVNVISLLRSTPAIPLPSEGHLYMNEVLLIDVDHKQLILNNSVFGLWETVSYKWPGYTLKMGRMGYLTLLEEAGISTIGLEMSQEEVQEMFLNMTKLQETYNPTGLLDKLTEQGTKIEVINPHFFDGVSPRPPLTQQIVQKLRRYFKGE